MAEQLSRAIAREWWSSHLEGDESEYDIKQMSLQAASELGGDPDFMESFANDFLESSLYDMGQRILSNRRAALRTTSTLRAQIDKDSESQSAEWRRWLEYDPETGKSVPLTDMVREQIKAAESRRRDEAAKYNRDADFFALIAKRLKPGQRVGDVFSDEALHKLRESMNPTRMKGAA